MIRALPGPGSPGKNDAKAGASSSSCCTMVWISGLRGTCAAVKAQLKTLLGHARRDVWSGNPQPFKKAITRSSCCFGEANEASKGGNQ